MIVLNTATRSLEYLLGGAVSANQLPFVVNYVNTSREGQTHPNSANGTSNNTTAVTILGAPSAGEKRNIQALNIYNADTASVTVTVRLNDNTTMRSIVVVTLAVGDTLIYTSASGWFVLTASGFIKSTSTAVNLDDLGDVVITSPATGAAFIYNGTNWVDGQLDLADGDARTGTLPVDNGGTGRATATAYAVLCGGTTATGAQQSIAGVGTSGQVLTSNGAGNLPTFQVAPAGVQAAVRFNAAGTISYNSNITSITDNGTGSWDVVIATDFSGAGNYAAAGMIGMRGSPDHLSINIRAASAAGTFAVTGLVSTTLIDPTTPDEIHVIFTGTQ